MATFPDATRNVQTNATVDLLDIGTGNPTMVIGTAGMATALITFLLDGTNACGASVAGTATGTGLPISATAANSSPSPAAYEVRDRDGTVIWSGTSISTTGGGGEVQISDLNIISGNDYSLTVFSYTSPAS